MDVDCVLSCRSVGISFSPVAPINLFSYKNAIGSDKKGKIKTIWSTFSFFFCILRISFSCRLACFIVEHLLSLAAFVTLTLFGRAALAAVGTGFICRHSA